jgi:TIR domain-containing protein
MADIFISYSKADHEQVRLLAAFLEAEGYSVWWDASLLSGENYRNVIMTELARARVALVVWTANSVHSDWVQSEAGRAQADHKLIPIKARGLEYKQIPPPFDVMHTENIDARDKILAAVVTQLAKPQTQAPALRLFSKRIRYETLGWIGAIGTALTLLNSLSPIMKLADWAHYLVENWGRLVLALWTTVLAFLPFKIDKGIAAILTANLCVLAMAVACRRGKAGAAERPSAEPGFMQQAPLVVLMSLILCIARGPSPGVPFAGQMAGLAFQVTLVASFLLILLAAGGRFVARGRLLPVLGGVAIMLAVSPIAAIVAFGIIAGLTYLIDPSIIDNITGIRDAGWSSFALVAGILGVAFAVMCSAPLVAVMLADRTRLYVRVFRAFVIVGLLALLNLLSVYGPAIRELFNLS